MDGRTIQEEVLGRLTWEDRLTGWSGQVELVPGQPVAIVVHPQSPDVLDALRGARRTLDGIRDREVHLRCAAADELLSWYNAEWNDGSPIRAEAFIARLSLDSIAFFPGDGADLLYQAGNLFEGHPVVIGVDADGEFQGATLPDS
jgi:hypothetical protein